MCAATVVGSIFINGNKDPNSSLTCITHFAVLAWALDENIGAHPSSSNTHSILRPVLKSYPEGPVTRRTELQSCWTVITRHSTLSHTSSSSPIMKILTACHTVDEDKKHNQPDVTKRVERSNATQIKTRISKPGRHVTHICWNTCTQTHLPRPPRGSPSHRLTRGAPAKRETGSEKIIPNSTSSQTVPTHWFFVWTV